MYKEQRFSARIVRTMMGEMVGKPRRGFPLFEGTHGVGSLPTSCISVGTRPPAFAYSYGGQDSLVARAPKPWRRRPDASQSGPEVPTLPSHCAGGASIFIDGLTGVRPSAIFGLVRNALFFLSITCASAELTITPDTAVRLALEKNPELQAGRKILAEAEGRAKSMGRLANPELTAEVAGGQDFEGRVEIGLSQRFPITSRLRLERNLSALQIQTARLEVQEKERQLAMSTRSAFVKVAAAREAISLASRQVEGAQAFAISLKNSAVQGIASGLDAAQAELTAEELVIARETLRSNESMAVGELATLLGLPADTVLVLKGDLTLPKFLPTNRSPAIRPDLALAEMAVEAGALDVSLAKASRWDDIGVGLFVEGERFRDEPEGIESETLLGLRLSIPLPLWKSGSGKITEKQADYERRQHQLEALRLAVRNQTIAAHRVMSAHYRAARKAESEIIPAARKQMNDTQTAYGRGEVDIQHLFRARERLIELEAAALEARKTFHLSFIEWLFTVGEIPSKL